ncbi:MAG: PepSY-associated TM helix domain-containing protein [Methyloceanibacter sp.]|uniref:PepSY-associated TM helix domain-containing protein n=1 Tax=Methyloceanibacter sp. TaxID=1965321 RepID=UPI003EDEC8C6
MPGGDWQDADLHNRLGVWGLPFHIAASLTGALLGLSVLIIGVLALAAYEGDSEKAFGELIGPQAGEDIEPAPLPDLAAMIARIRADHSDSIFSSAHVEHAGTAGQMTHLSMRTPGYLSSANPYYFEGSGKLVGDGGLESGSVGQQILGALQPIHFGWFGGMTVKIVYGLLGLALTIVTHTGVTIWLHRRREKGRPTPFWERIWAALAWSQPFALAAAALVALTASPALILPKLSRVLWGCARDRLFLSGRDRVRQDLASLIRALVMCGCRDAYRDVLGSGNCGSNGLDHRWAPHRRRLHPDGRCPDPDWQEPFVRQGG